LDSFKISEVGGRLGGSVGEGEAGSLDAGLDPRTPGLWPGPKADAQ